LRLGKALVDAVLRILSSLPGKVGSMVKSAVSSAISSAKGAAGSALGKFIPGKASGGPVVGGNAYIVGEKGPELFVPGSSGQVVPNHDLAGGSKTVIVKVEGAQVGPLDEQRLATWLRRAEVLAEMG
jgi:phage-related minor tail protein